jgi:hypothetical protein
MAPHASPSARPRWRGAMACVHYLTVLGPSPWSRSGLLPRSRGFSRFASWVTGGLGQWCASLGLTGTRGAGAALSLPDSRAWPHS